MRRAWLQLMLALGVQALAGCRTLQARADMPAADTAAAAAAPVAGALRGRLTVTGLRTPPGSIDLPYRHYRRGPGPRPTVFFLGGGPGLGNLKFVPPESWLRQFDVVVPEYRGVGESSIVLHSEHFARALRQPLAGLSLRHAEGMQPAFHAAFADLQRQRIHFAEFSVSEMADDLERLRRQLGLDQIHLVGHSFGTRVALHYQTRYRERAAGSVLFSMNTPGGFLWYPADTQSVWRRYRDRLARTRPALHAALDGLLRAPSPRPGHYGPFRIDDAQALLVAFFLSFNASTRDRALRAMASAADGHAGWWYLFSLAYGQVIRHGFNWADFFIKAYTSDCDPAAVELVDRQGRDALFESPSAVLFSATRAFEAAGGRCVADRFEPDYRHTLAVVGEFDPSTPIERRPAALPADRFVVVENAGHADVLYADPGAAAAWLTGFFLPPGPGLGDSDRMRERGHP